MTNHSNRLEGESSAAATARTAGGRVWVLRVVGCALLVLGWSMVVWTDLGSAQIAADSIVFLSLAGYGFAAAISSRRMHVNIEKKLRLDLLVRNIELEHLAMRDDLTQLFNRRYFFERLERELTASRDTGRPLSLIVVDMDGLKSVNDTYGHRVGDQVLTGFGQFLLVQTRASDIAARIGGDEFGIILPDTTKASAELTVERLYQAMEMADLLEGRDVRLTVGASVGLSGFPWSGATVDELILRADASMYLAKRTRKQQGAALPGKGEGDGGGEGVPAMFRPETSAKPDAA